MADLGICLSVFTRRAASLESDLNFGPSVAVCIPCALKIEGNYPCFLEKKTEVQMTGREKVEGCQNLSVNRSLHREQEFTVVCNQWELGT